MRLILHGGVVAPVFVREVVRWGVAVVPIGDDAGEFQRREADPNTATRAQGVVGDCARPAVCHRVESYLSGG
jgi:hypothetical protein